MPEEKSLPKPETEFPKPEKDLPLPEKEITSGSEVEEGKVVNDQNSSYAKTDNNLGRKAILIVILLILLYPIGVIFMWFKTSWPKWVKFLLTIPFILGILGLILGIVFFSKIASNDLTDNLYAPSSGNQIATPTPTPTDETSDWKTHNSVLFNISFSYPSNWIVDEADGNGYPSNLDVRNYDSKAYNEEIQKQRKNTPDGFKNLFRIHFSWLNAELVQTKPSNIDLISFVKSQVSNTMLFTFENTKINNLPAVFVKKNSPDHLGPLYQMYILKENKVYKIEAYSDYPIDTISGLNEFELVFKKILSTFKFTDSNSQTQTQPTGSMVACTMEAKLCPDGVTYVSRSGPDCEFAKCPGE